MPQSRENDRKVFLNYSNTRGAHRDLLFVYEFLCSATGSTSELLISKSDSSANKNGVGANQNQLAKNRWN